MQNSRFNRIGKQTLKNRSNFTLLQQINTQQFSNDKPIKNASTLYLDQNGKQKQIQQLKNQSTKNRIANKNSFSYQQKSQIVQGQDNQSDMYSLPVVNSKQQIYGRNKIKNQVQIGDKSKNNSRIGGSQSGGKFIKSQYMSDRLDVKKRQNMLQNNVSNISSKTQNKKSNILNIKRPNGFARRGQKFQEIDFIGGNLYQVQDIISDISKIIDHSKRKNIIASTKQPKDKNTLKANKWLNSHFGGLSKLDQMLGNYKSTPDQQPSFPIIQDYYRQSTYKKQQNQLQTPKLQPNTNTNKNKINSFNFGSRSKNSNQHKLTFAVIKWNQMPMIPTKWQPSIYLKLQSFPQQQQYRKVVLKAYSLGIKSYSIFIFSDAGLIRANSSNDKNHGQQSLMSQQQYAKKWQQKYMQPASSSSSQPQSSLTEQQKQLLMQFDIQWYRAIVQFCYHLGLQDLLQKQYDITTYTTIMNSIQRQQQISTQNIIQNQINYMKDYFKQVYTYSSNQVMMGMIRIQNDGGMEVKQIENNFAAMFGKGSSQKIGDQFCVWPLKQDNSSLVVILQLCGSTSKNIIYHNKQQQKIQINLQNKAYKIQITQQFFQLKKQLSQGDINKQEQGENNIPAYKLVFKQSQENDWEVIMKIQDIGKDSTKQNKLNIMVSQELLFGVIYQVNMKK